MIFVISMLSVYFRKSSTQPPRLGLSELSPSSSWFPVLFSAAEKRGLWEGVVQEPLRRALFCVFLCSEVIFSCKSHRNFFQKLPLQCRHFLENPLAKNPKTQLLIFVKATRLQNIVLANPRFRNIRNMKTLGTTR